MVNKVVKMHKKEMNLDTEPWGDSPRWKGWGQVTKERVEAANEEEEDLGRRVIWKQDEKWSVMSRVALSRDWETTAALEMRKASVLWKWAISLEP